MCEASVCRKTRRRLHQPDPVVLDLEGAEDGPLAVGPLGVNPEVAGEARLGPQPLVGDLVTQRAGHAVRGEQIRRGGGRTDRQVFEDGPEAAAGIRRVAGHRHVALGAFVLDGGAGLRMVHGFAPDRRLPIRIARRIGHHRGPPVETDGDVLPGVGDESVVTGEAGLAGGEQIRGVNRAGLRLGGGRNPGRTDDQETQRPQDDSQRYPTNHGELPAIEEPSVEPVPKQIDQHP